MTKPVFLITIGAAAGAVIGVINGGGELGHAIAQGLIDRGAQVLRMADVTPAATRAAPPAGAADSSHFVFSACLSKSGAGVEGTLRNLLEFHEHDATVSLVGCLLGGAPQRFCTPEGRQLAADAMEIYLWSRDDGRHASPAHGLAAKIHMIDRNAKVGDDAPAPDLFALTWSGPDDVAIFDKVKSLVRDGWLDPSAFSFSGRAELREALRGVVPTASPCSPLARED
jgi:hypothetical protein